MGPGAHFNPRFSAIQPGKASTLEPPPCAPLQAAQAAVAQRLLSHWPRFGPFCLPLRQMSSPEMSPKHPNSRSMGSAFDAQAVAPFAEEGPPEPASPPAGAAITLTPVRPLEKAPTAMDLIQDDDFILDPATPATPKHRQVEAALLRGPGATVLRHHLDAVIKIFSTHTRPNFEQPWQSCQQTTSKSTGFAVAWGGGRYVLTNAHSVSYASQVQLKRRGDDERFTAKVVSVGTECDTALLEVPDDEFWAGVHPLELWAALPELQQPLYVLGYPIGGDSLAISAGVVSRVSMTHYAFGCTILLAVQTDAAINSGNSGGPVLDVNGAVCGIAFQSYSGDVAQSIGYVIPTSVVRHFLDDVHRHDRYTGFPSLNVTWQEMESKALKRAYGLGPHDKGVLVRRVAAAAAEAAHLRRDDIILAIDGVAVGSDGTVPFRHGERVDFKYLVTKRFVGEDIHVDIARGGERRAVSFPLSPYLHLVPPHTAEQKPSYFMAGGLVFTACSDKYLTSRYGSLGNAPVRLMAKSYFGTKAAPDEQVVVLSNVLACAATMGYDATVGVRDSAVVAFNGTAVTNLVHLARMVGDCDEEFMRFDMESGRVVILETVAARQATADVMEQNNVGAAMSRDVEEALKGGPAKM